MILVRIGSTLKKRTGSIFRVTSEGKRFIVSEFSDLLFCSFPIKRVFRII